MNTRTRTLAGLAGVTCAALGYTNAHAADLAQMPVVAGQVSTSSVTSGTVTVQFSKSAMVRVLDKQTNRVDHLTLEAGKTQKWGGLSITLQRCGWDVGGVAVQDAAWLDATAGSGEPEFHGWMFNTFPSVSTYDHPRYDVELEKCARPAGYTTVAPARVAPPTPSGQDKEGGDDEAPSGAGGGGVNNEFVVPGIQNGGAENVAPVTAPAASATPAAVLGTGAPIPPAAEPTPQQPAADPHTDMPAPEPEQPAPDQRNSEPAAITPPQPGDQQQLQRMMDTPAQ